MTPVPLMVHCAADVKVPPVHEVYACVQRELGVVSERDAVAPEYRDLRSGALNYCDHTIWPCHWSNLEEGLPPVSTRRRRGRGSPDMLPGTPCRWVMNNYLYC